MSYALSCRGVNLSRTGTKILHRVSFDLYPGELCALLGPSGAGKSTLMRAVLGEADPDDGDVTRRGRGGGEMSVGYVPQDDAVHKTLSGRTALRYAAELRLANLDKKAQHQRVDEVIAQVGLTERADLPVRRLSGGQRKRVSLALELLTAPDLLILDEPTSGLDPGLERKMMGLFRSLAEEGRVVIVATHAMESLRQCHMMLMLVKGHVAYFGPPEQALSHFSAPTFAEVFAVLDKQSPQKWQAAYASSPLVAKVKARPAPPIKTTPVSKKKTSPVTASSAPTAKKDKAPTASADKAPTPAPGGPEDDLAALKKKMGLS